MSHQDPVKLSIITVNLNDPAGLQKTFDSVFSQTFKDYEFIVIDGGSTDESKAIIERHSKGIQYWISEKDSGVYAAMNKGIQKASGEYYFFLNSGDYLMDSNTLTDINALLSGTHIVYGNLFIKATFTEWIKKYPENLSFDYFTHETIPHSGGSFIHSSLFKTVGLYDEKIRICADWMFYVDAIFKHNATTKYIDQVISVFNFDGISSKPENQALVLNEKKMFIESNYKLLYVDQQVPAESNMTKLYDKMKRFFNFRNAQAL